MAMCDNCVSGLGLVTVYVLGSMRTIECPVCRGVGHTCCYCDGNPATCGCYDENDPPPPPRKEKY